MRIDAYTQVQQLYQSQVMSRSQKTGTVSQKEKDKLQISNTGKDYHVAKAMVAACPDVREDVMAPIKLRIQNGTYEVSTEAFAEKLLGKYEEMR